MELKSPTVQPMRHRVVLTPARLQVADEFQNDSDVKESLEASGVFVDDFLLQQEDCVVCLRWKKRECVSALAPREQRRAAGRVDAIDRAIVALYRIIC